MSTRFAVGSTPSRLVFGSNRDERALLNLGPSTVYVGDQSAVTPFVDMPIDVGGSFTVLPGQELWAVCASGLTSQLSAVSRFEQRFAYSQPVGKLLYQAGATTVSPNGWTWTADATLASQFSSVLVTVGPPPGYLGAPLAIGGTLEMYVAQGPNLPVLDNAFGAGVPWSGQWSGGVFPADSASGGNYYQAVFPLTGLGFTVTVFTVDGTLANNFISVYGLRTPVPGTMVNNQGLRSMAPTTGLTAYYTQMGNTYTVNVPTVSAGLTGSVLRLPTVPGPVRVMVQGTQNAAGTFTATFATYARTITSLITAPVYAYGWYPIDAAAISSTTTGSKFAAAQYGVWPTSPAGLQIVTGAGVTVSNLVVSILAGGQ